MEFMQLLDMILHIDKYLGTIIGQYGSMIYGVLSTIVFAETGLVIFPFLPGDSLLFIAGATTASGEMQYTLLVLLLIFAAVAGNTVNYWIGRAIGQKVFTHHYRWLDRAALQRTHAFYEKHGGKMLVMARFIPIVRTFAPFVAGVSVMSFGKFQFFNMAGALLWVIGLVTAGYYFGNIPVVRDHLNTIVLIGLGAAIIPLLLGGAWKVYRKLAGSRA